ncbi:MAG: histidinol phosphatase [Flavobacteriales bacterium]|nr:histidinol phosphatase [Flavobacteriales bacterium]
MTDIHSHLLPGVDDGSKSEEESLSLLNTLSSYGVKRVFLTPHIMAGNGNEEQKLRAVFQDFEKKNNSGIELRLACEYMMDEQFLPHMGNGLLSYDGEHVLVETSFMGCSMTAIQQILFEISLKGYLPILAHPERYAFMSKNDYKLLKDYGCEFQLNIAALGGRYGSRIYDNAKYLMDNYMYNYAGSDIHGERHLGVYNTYEMGKKTLYRLSLLLENNITLWK